MHAGMKLKLTDMQGREIKQVVAGYPCKIQLSIDAAQGMQQSPQIPGLDKASVRGHETRMNIVNGHRSMHYGYIVSFDKSGTYAVGPVEVENNGTTYRSNVLSITVGAAPAQIASLPDDESEINDKPLFARLVANKKRAFVGEKITCALELYYAYDDLKLQKIIEPDFNNLTVASRKGHFSRGIKIIDGVSYQCVEWQWELYPQKAGTITLPAFGIDYAKPVDQEQVFDFFWGPRYTPARAYSNALEFTIEPLPPHEKEIKAIGKFSHFTASIKPSTATIGEGIVLTLCLQGEGDLEHISLEPLSQIPSQLTWYDSKQYIDDAGQGVHQKCFEYIIQGMEAGEWKIPAQTFTYFDIKKRKYITLSTPGVAITITSDKKVAPTQVSSNQEHRDEQMIDEELQPLGNENSWLKHTEYFIPWWLFFVIVSSLSIGSLLLIYIRTRTQKIGYRSRKQLFSHTHDTLHDAEKKGEVQKIYTIFSNLFSSLLNVSDGNVSGDMIDELLQKKGLSFEQQAAWKQFFDMSAALVFSRRAPTSNKQIMFQQAHQWLDIFEKAL